MRFSLLRFGAVQAQWRNADGGRECSRRSWRACEVRSESWSDSSRESRRRFRRWSLADSRRLEGRRGAAEGARLRRMSSCGVRTFGAALKSPKSFGASRRAFCVRYAIAARKCLNSRRSASTSRPFTKALNPSVDAAILPRGLPREMPCHAGCHAEIEGVRGKLKDGAGRGLAIFRRNLERNSRPAGLEPATSWFVAVA